MGDDDANDSGSQSSPHDSWTQALGVPANAFASAPANPTVDVVTGADPAAQPAAQSGWSFNPVDPSKAPPIDPTQLPPSVKYGPSDPVPPVPDVPSQPPPSGGGDSPPAPQVPPARVDPDVGQNKTVDPNDKGWGLKGTWDIDKKPKVTGAYGDLPKGGGINPQGDPAEISPSPGGQPAGPQIFPQPSGPAPPGKVWNPVLGAWESYKPADLPKPPPAPPAQPGDYNVPDGDTANV